MEGTGSQYEEGEHLSSVAELEPVANIGSSEFVDPTAGSEKDIVVPFGKDPYTQQGEESEAILSSSEGKPLPLQVCSKTRLPSLGEISNAPSGVLSAIIPSLLPPLSINYTMGSDESPIMNTSNNVAFVTVADDDTPDRGLGFERDGAVIDSSSVGDNAGNSPLTNLDDAIRLKIKKVRTLKGSGMAVIASSRIEEYRRNSVALHVDLLRAFVPDILIHVS